MEISIAAFNYLDSYYYLYWNWAFISSVVLVLWQSRKCIEVFGSLLGSQTVYTSISKLTQTITLLLYYFLSNVPENQ